MTEPFTPEALTGDAVRLSHRAGPKIHTRSARLDDWVALREREGLYAYERSFDSAIGPTARIRSSTGVEASGINFCAQDYLGLTADPRLREAAVEAIHRFGTHSAGSAMAAGRTALSDRLTETLASLTGMEHIVLFPTGWMAGFGTVSALVRPGDHVLIDELAHSCLRMGAAAATSKVVRFPHLDNAAVAEHLAEIRRRSARTGILVVTEGTYSMDSDSPDLAELQRLCTAHDATLLVDVAHDFGATGKHGGGRIEEQGLVGTVDLVVGSFSKTFATTGGFLATNSLTVKRTMTVASEPWMFGAGLGPVPCAVADAAGRIIGSYEGAGLRARLLTNAVHLRDLLAAHGIELLGEPSAVVPVLLRSDALARIVTAWAARDGVLVNMAEAPAVPHNTARLRLQLMATHDDAQLELAARTLVGVIGEAGRFLDRTA